MHIRIPYLFLGIAILSIACKNNPAHSFSLPNNATPGSILPLTEAVQILGEPAIITDSTMTHEGETLTYKSTFTAIDSVAARPGHLYFMLERYPNIDAASKSYNSIKRANENHGIDILADLGDEAYYHTDNYNFYFILVRKGELMYRIKLSKVNHHSSEMAFKEVARKIAERI
jgi:hypothetical protein